MSIESMAVVLHHSKAGGTDKLVLLGIANHDGDGGAWPSVATLARYANVEPRAVKSSIKRLIDRGEVTRDIQGGGGRYTPDYSRPNRYEIKVACPPECDRSAQHRIDRSDRVSPTTPGVVQRTPPGVSGAYPPGGTGTTPEPSLNHSNNSEKSPVASTSPAGGICWSCCGSENVRGLYCTSCSSRGLNNPMINCAGDCGQVTRREFPGQHLYRCAGCSRAQGSQAALDHDGAGS